MNGSDTKGAGMNEATILCEDCGHADLVEGRWEFFGDCAADRDFEADDPADLFDRCPECNGEDISISPEDLVAA